MNLSMNLPLVFGSGPVSIAVRLRGLSLHEPAAFLLQSSMFSVQCSTFVLTFPGSWPVSRSKMEQVATHEPAPAERARPGRRNVDCLLGSIIIRNPELANNSVAGTATLRLVGNTPVPGMTRFMAPKHARKRVEALHEPAAFLLQRSTFDVQRSMFNVGTWSTAHLFRSSWDR